jgi:hypothetical protein
MLVHEAIHRDSQHKCFSSTDSIKNFLDFGHESEGFNSDESALSNFQTSFQQCFAVHRTSTENPFSVHTLRCYRAAGVNAELLVICSVDTNSLQNSGLVFVHLGPFCRCYSCPSRTFESVCISDTPAIP